MVLLVADPIDPEVLQWLGARQTVRQVALSPREPRALRDALRQVRAVIVPSAVAIDAATLAEAPVLQAVARLDGGTDNIDLAACQKAGVEVVRPSDASALAEAEFAIGALLQMLRRVPVVNAEGLLVGRELRGATVGIVGLTPAAQQLSRLLDSFGARVIGYDPALHASDPRWQRWDIEPLSLASVTARSDALCVMLGLYSRYQGLLGERYLAHCCPNQVVLCLAPTSLFDENALADVLATGRMAAAWFDCMEPDWMAPGRPLQQIDTVQVTPRVASITRESRVRAAWEVARRLHALLLPTGTRPSPAPPRPTED